MLKFYRTVVAGALLGAMSGFAQAAQEVRVAQNSAAAYVDSGPGFTLAKPGQSVAQGARVMAVTNPVVLSDASGCTATIKPGDLLALSGTSLCAASMRAAAQNTSGGRSDPNDWIWIPVVGGVVAAFILLGDDNKKKTSP